MSVVTNVILAIASGDDEFEDQEPRVPPGLQHVKDWCLGADPDSPTILRLPRWPRPADEGSGGAKHLECGVYCWGANYLDIAGFLRAVATAPWEWPECVQVFIKGHEEERFRMLSLRPETRTWVTYGDEPGWMGYPWGDDEEAEA